MDPLESKGPSTSSRDAGFLSTHWSIILRAGETSSADTQAAIKYLCETYWFPLYAYVRRQGISPDRACDITQGFFAQFLAGPGIANVHPDKGRLRAFMLASIKNYLKNEWREENTIRRGGNVKTISIDDEEFEQLYQDRLSVESNAESQFEKDWVEALLRRVLEGLRQDYEAAGRLELYQALHPYLTASEERLPLAELAAKLALGLSTVKMSIHRIRKQYAERVRQEVLATVESPGQVDDELNRMITLMRH